MSTPEERRAEIAQEIREIATRIAARKAEAQPKQPGQEQPEEGTVVYVLHMPGAKTYIGQPRQTGPEPEAGQ